MFDLSPGEWVEVMVTLALLVVAAFAVPRALGFRVRVRS